MPLTVTVKTAQHTYQVTTNLSMQEVQDYVAMKNRRPSWLSIYTVDRLPSTFNCWQRVDAINSHRAGKPQGCKLLKLLELKIDDEVDDYSANVERLIRAYLDMSETFRKHPIHEEAKFWGGYKGTVGKEYENYQKTVLDSSAIELAWAADVINEAHHHCQPSEFYDAETVRACFPTNLPGKLNPWRSH